MRRRALTLVIPAVLALLAVTAGTTASALAATAPASGYNDWTCRPSATHPDPVVLIHGLTSNANENWSTDGPYLANAGYCAFAPTYGVEDGIGGMAPIPDSAAQIASYIDQVLAATGAAKVDLVGHSEGGFLALYIPKVLGYAPKVGRVIALGPPTHEDDGLLSGLSLGQLMPSDPSNDPWAALNQGPVTELGVSYTIIATKTDLLIIPATESFVNEPGVLNEWVQDDCPLDLVGHVGLATDSTVSQMITNALDPTTAAPVLCGNGLPV
ncbi:MAG TPA: alpha/beta fold hydrolase [Pseudonocardiaceae bacterium]|jgi:pimeloyl-ACP methyl ester carboxylesterase|nr:alpha/beta fold hydrolase [Pseudonocardiaceae bacterium]